MADLTPKVINELPEASSLSDNDLFALMQGSSSKKTLWSTIKNAVLNAIQYPISVAHGGTGSTNGADALATLGSVDYVIEKGTSGIWKYQKWKSGLAECWGTQEYSVTMSTVWTAPIYYHSTPIKEDLPANLFTSVSDCQYSASGGLNQTGADCWAGSASATPFTTSQTNGIYILRVGSQSTAKTIRVSWRVVGRWVEDDT